MKKGLFIVLSLFLCFTLLVGQPSISTLIYNANNDDVASQGELGIRYYYGNGVEKDRARAFVLFEMSAEAGDSSGMARLGQAYFYQFVK